MLRITHDAADFMEIEISVQHCSPFSLPFKTELGADPCSALGRAEVCSSVLEAAAWPPALSG